MSLERTMVRGSLWCALDGWASELANLAIFLVLVRLLGPEEFGLVALAAVFTTIATDLFGYSVSQVLVQRRDLSPGLCDTVFFVVLGLAGSAALLFFALAPLVAGLFDAPLLIDLLRWLCLTVLLHGLAAVPLALLTREMRFDAIAKRSLAMIAGGGAVGITLAAGGFGPWALVGQALTQAMISALVLYGAARWRPGRRFAWTHVAAIRGYASTVAGNRIVMLFDERVPQFVIGLALGPAAVGYFAIALRLVDILIRMFVVPVNQVAMPAIARVQEDPARVRGILAGGIGVASLVSCPAFLGAAVVAPELVPLALGAAWTPAVPVLQLLALRGIVWPVMLYGTSLLYGVGRPGRLFAINLIDLAANVALLLAAAPLGLVALAAVSTGRILLLRWPLVGHAIATVAGLSLARQAALLAPAVLASGAMAAVLLILRGYLAPALAPAATLPALVGAGALLYVLAVLAIRPGAFAAGWRLLADLRRPTGTVHEG